MPGVGRAYCVLDVAPGVVRVVLIPELGDPERPLEPEELAPGRALIREVSAELDERKIVGTMIEYEGVSTSILEIDAHLFAEPGVDEEQLAAAAEADLRHFLHPAVGGHRGGRAGSWALPPPSPRSRPASRACPASPSSSACGSASPARRPRVRRRPTTGLLVLTNCYVLVEHVE